MPRLSVEEQLDDVIKEAAMDADPDQATLTVARDLCESNRDLIEHFSGDWVTEKVASLIRKYRRNVKFEASPQMLLGFAVPKTVILASGKKTAFGELTLYKMNRVRGHLAKKKSRTLENVEKAIAVMEMHATPEHPDMTYDEAAALEVERLRKARGR